MMMVQKQDFIAHIALFFQCQNWYMGNMIKQILHDDVERHPVCPMMIVKLKMGIIMMMLVMIMMMMMVSAILFARWWLSNWRRGDGLLVAARYDHRDWSHQSIPFLLLHLINIHHHSINIFYVAFWSCKLYPQISQHQSWFPYRDFWGCENCGSQNFVSYFFLCLPT